MYSVQPIFNVGNTLSSSIFTSQFLVLQNYSKARIATDSTNEGTHEDNVTVYNVATQLNKNDLIKQIGPGEYVVKRTTYSESRIVNLIPKNFSLTKCTCHASATCAHVVAVQMHLGCFDHETKKPKNSTLALKRARKPADKTSGRKRPRKKDVDPPSLSNKLTPKVSIYQIFSGIFEYKCAL